MKKLIRFSAEQIAAGFAKGWKGWHSGSPELYQATYSFGDIKFRDFHIENKDWGDGED